MNRRKIYLYGGLIGGGLILGTLITAIGFSFFSSEEKSSRTSSQESNDSIQVTDILSAGEKNRKAFSGTIQSVSGTEQIVVTSESDANIPVNITPSTIVIERKRKTNDQFEKDRQAYNSGESDQPPSLYETSSMDAEELKKDDNVNIQTVDNIVGATEVEARRISVNISVEEQEGSTDTSSENSEEQSTENENSSSDSNTSDEENSEEEGTN